MLRGITRNLVVPVIVGKQEEGVYKAFDTARCQRLYLRFGRNRELRADVNILIHPVFQDNLTAKFYFIGSVRYQQISVYYTGSFCLKIRRKITQRGGIRDGKQEKDKRANGAGTLFLSRTIRVMSGWSRKCWQDIWSSGS